MYRRIRMPLTMGITVLISLFMLGCGYTMLRAPRAPSEEPPKVVDEWLESEDLDRDVAMREEGSIDDYDPLAPRLRNRGSYPGRGYGYPGDYYYYDQPGYYSGYGYPIYSAYYGDSRGFYTDPATGYPVPVGYKLEPIDESDKTDSSSQAETPSEIEKVKVPEGYKLVPIEGDPEGGYMFVPIPGYTPSPDSKKEIRKVYTGTDISDRPQNRPRGHSLGSTGSQGTSGQQAIGASKPTATQKGSKERAERRKRSRGI